MIESDRSLVPAVLRFQSEVPSPLPRMVLWTATFLLAIALTGSWLGRLDVVAIAQGRLVPERFVKIVQPVEAGVVREILVQEGEVVRAGQVLARMDARLAEADGTAVQEQLTLAQLELRRIDAELSDRPLSRFPSDAAAAWTRVAGKLEARREALKALIDTERATIERARGELRAAVEVQQRWARTAPLDREEADAWDRLAREGFAGRLQVLERRRRQVGSEQELRAQAETVAGLRAALQQAERRLAQARSAHRQQLLDERVQVHAELDRLQHEARKLDMRATSLELRAPVDGTVNELATHTEGAVMQPGAVLMTLVPRDGALQAEIWIDHIDAGLVREQQPAQLKLAAFPFQRYGLVAGRVKYMSPDASEPASSTDDGHAGRRAGGFRALIAIEGEGRTHDGVAIPMTSGMQVTAEIHIGQRRIIDYVLSPIRRVVHEAGRET
ncbi:MAG: HlyD family type I secretion periplasmic adaptor subunit [Burkholderiales bacterium]|nr:HlyD family type I secretion periplasmic adaptor subunit [Burkholderiales bacterium]